MLKHKNSREAKVRKRWLTHLLPQHPRLRARVDLHEDRGRAHQEHHEVREAQVDEEDVGRVAEVLGLEDDQRHHHIADDADAHDDDAEDHGGGADVPGELDGGRRHRRGRRRPHGPGVLRRVIHKEER